ncbi:MAG: FecR family protein [bacterium]
MEQKYDDTFLARWLANDLTEKELSDFESSSDYSYYKQIIDEVDHANFPEYDLETNLQATWRKIENQSNSQPQVKRLWPIWLGAAAACLVLFLGISFVLKETSYSTQNMEVLALELPDGSQVELNSESNLTYKNFRWENKRELTLKGEAYFKVQKGEVFTVHTDFGDVTVLGTQFIINSRPNFFNVTCYEGSVKVVLNNQEKTVLTRGKALQLQDTILEKYEVRSAEPSWLDDESSFYNVSIIEVLEELERKYNIEIKGKEYVKPAKFTGRFRHDNLNVALKTVFNSMGIAYTLQGNKTVIIKN